MDPTEPLIPSDDRDRGIITTVDRKFLKGEKEYNGEQSERDARYRIRQRLRDSFLDFSILLRYLDKRDRDQVFEVFETDDSLPDIDASMFTKESLGEMMGELSLRMGIVDSLSFIYTGVESSGQSFEAILETAIESAEEQKGYVIQDVSVEITIDRETPDVDNLLNRLQEGDQLSKSEISTVLRSGQLDINEETLGLLFSQMGDSLASSDVEIDFKSDSEEAQ